MAIKLGRIPTEPYWIDLAHGVRLYVRPLDTATYQTCRAHAVHQVRQVIEEALAVKEAGGEVTGLPDPEDKEAREGLSQQLFAQALARAAICERGPTGEGPGWEGVEAVDDDRPAEVTDEAVNDLMRIHSLADDFLDKYCRTHEAIIAEKNASGVAANGTGAAARPTADDAQSKAPPAPKGGE